jgi:hypothetical protein
VCFPGRPTSIARLASALVVSALALAPAVARGDDGVAAGSAHAVQLLGPEGLPFSNEELDQALLARLLRDEAAHRPVPWMEPADAGEVVVHVGERSRVVAVGDRTGPAAARVVALVIAELLSNTEAAPSEHAAPAAAAAAADPSAPIVVVAEPPPAGSPAAIAPATSRTIFAAGTRLSVTAGISKGTGVEELASGAVDADLVLPVGRGRLCIAPSLGLTAMPTRNAGSYDQVSFHAAVARVLGGGSWGPVALLGGPFASSYSIDGATQASGVLFGAEALVRLEAPLFHQLRLVAAGRGDVFADRVRVRWADGRAYATPRLGLSLGLGLAWEWPA